MPLLSIWFIRTAVVYLGLGFTFGALMLANKGIPFYPQLWALFPVHIEFLLIGWTVQLAMGVAFWILPRFGREPKRGNVKLAWTAFILINMGVLFVTIHAFWAGSTWLYVGGRTMEVAAAATYAIYAWPRVKPFG